jgi:transcriptional regulator with XRE-family HTH domain
MVTNAKEIVEAAEKAGLTQKRMAEICKVSPVTISRWKMLGIARTSTISRLQQFLDNPSARETTRKYLDEASLEDLAERARQLGFRISFTDIQITMGPTILGEQEKGESPMLFKRTNDYSFKKDTGLEHTYKLCHNLISGRRGATLGKEILAQLKTGRLTPKTYARLSRWVNPEREEPFAQPIAAEISRELYGREIERMPG